MAPPGNGVTLGPLAMVMFFTSIVGFLPSIRQSCTEIVAGNVKEAVHLI